jgi:hypothetical protein
MHKLDNANPGLARRVSKPPSPIAIQVDRNRNNGSIYLHGGLTPVRRAGIILEKPKNLSHDVHGITASTIHVYWCFLKQQTLRGSDE